MGKETACNGGDAGVTGSVPGLGKSPEEGMATHPPIFSPGESPWTEDPGRLQSMRLQKVDTTE